MHRVGIGTKTSTGGEVIEGNSAILVDGLVASSVGHQATCKACKKGIGPIVAVGPRDEWLPAGLAARAGDYVACGCPPGANVLLPEGTVFVGAYGGGQAAASRVMAVPEHAPFIFAKSSTVPLKTIDAGTAIEPLSNFGQAMTLAPLSSESKSETPSAQSANAQAGVGVVALGRVSGASIAEFGAWSLRATASMSSAFLMAFWPSDIADGTLYTDEQLKGMSQAATRVRFRFSEDEEGKMQVYGIHTSAESGLESVPVVNARIEGQALIAAVPGGPTLTWYPDERGQVADASSYYPDDSGLDIQNIWVRPISDAPEYELGTYPIEDRDLLDCIITFPVATGLPPLYLVFSKPPVKLLEVDTYRGFQGRPRGGTHADHMPSAAAIERYLTLANPGLTFIEISALKKDVAALIVPASVHQKCSETYGGRNTPSQIEKDAKDLKSAVDRNINAIKGCLRDEGFSDAQIEQARQEMHQVNREQGWYR